MRSAEQNSQAFGGLQLSFFSTPFTPHSGFVNPEFESGRVFEEGVHAHREAHVAFDLKFALHEEAHSIRLTLNEIKPIRTRRLEGGRWVCVLSFLGFALSVLNDGVEFAGLFAGQFELQNGVEVTGGVGLKTFGHTVNEGLDIRMRHEDFPSLST